MPYNRTNDEYVVYHPNATPGEANYDPNHLCEAYNDKLATHFSCSISKTTPAITLRLSSGKKYSVKWFDPSTGIYYQQSDIVGRDTNYTFIAPPAFNGMDAILHLKGEMNDKKVAIKD